MIFNKQQDVLMELTLEDVLEQLYIGYDITQIFGEWPSEGEKEELREEIIREEIQKDEIQ